MMEADCQSSSWHPHAPRHYQRIYADSLRACGSHHNENRAGLKENKKRGKDSRVKPLIVSPLMEINSSVGWGGETAVWVRVTAGEESVPPGEISKVKRTSDHSYHMASEGAENMANFSALGYRHYTTASTLGARVKADTGTFRRKLRRPLVPSYS